MNRPSYLKGTLMHDHVNAMERGIDEPLVDDSEIRGRISECTISDCQFGCKYYHDPVTDLVVLGHQRSYGCKRTKADILANPREQMPVKLHETVQHEVWIDPIDPEVATNVS